MSTAHANANVNANASQHYADAKLIWDYHQLGHQLRPYSGSISET